MSKVSVLIPSNKERFLQRTIDDVLEKARGDVEVIAVLDGYWPDPPLKDDPRLITVHRGVVQGMRAGINSAAAVARGEFLLKLDAHCMLDEGFDLKMQNEMVEPNWVAIPRRYSLDAEAWAIAKTGKPPIDYHFLCWPWKNLDELGMHGEPWFERGRQRKDELVDDEMSSQGSCWCMRRSYFWDFLGGLNEHGYGNFVQEFQEIGNKTWLGGGRVIINKKTWYAHLHKGKTYGRGYYISKPKMYAGTVWSMNWWMSNVWDKRVRDIEWLIDKFSPLPGWPADWQEQVNKWRATFDKGTL
jgi:glycosyltransferase involved in cell wall biosynthesis